MAGTRVEMAPEGEIRGFLAARLGDVFDKNLGPAIAADAERAAPKLTGKLAASIDFELRTSANGLPVLIIGSFDDRVGRVPYAAAVEMGFHGMEAVRSFVTTTGKRVKAHMRRGNTPEQPYLRPALYRKRSS